MKPSTKRITYIDALRSIAILLMLEGHFISGLLKVKDSYYSNPIYVFWEYMRGLTAPVFFTVTGFIFVFLLLKEESISYRSPRIRKGLKRGLELILWGYVLRNGILGVLTGYHSDYYYYTDVLQIIGLSILLICLFFCVCKSLQLLKYLFLVLSFLIFISYLTIDTVNYDVLPLPLTHYFTRNNGAVFTLLPWFGYVCFGAFLAFMFTKHQHRPDIEKLIVRYFLVIGSALMVVFSPLNGFALEYLHLDTLKQLTESNYLFERLGGVLVLIAIVVHFKAYFKNPYFLKIGQVTLSIYIVHHILLYGSWANTGLYRWFAASLTPVQAVIGVLFFIATVLFLVLKYRDAVNSYVAKLFCKVGFKK